MRIVSGGGPAFNAGLSGAAAGPAAGSGGLGGALSGAADWIGQKASDTGDWLDRHEKQIVPALSFLGSMLSSPSRTLAGSIGSGMVGGAKSLQAQQELGQGQQRIGISQQQVDITKNAQIMSLWAQVRQMYNASKTVQNPDGDPGLKAQLTRLAGMMQQSGGGNPGPTPGGPQTPAGEPPPNLAPTAPPPAQTAPAPAPAPASAAPTPAPAAPAAAPGTPPIGAVPPGQAAAQHDGCPNQQSHPNSWTSCRDTMRPDKLEALGNSLKAGGDPTGQGQKYLDQANQIRSQIIANGGAVGKNNVFVDLPGANELKTAMTRPAENNDWQVKQQPVFQNRQVMKQSVGEIVKQLQSFEPGEFSHVKADIQASIRGATGMTPPSTSTMNAEAYQIFLKNAAQIIASGGASSGDGHTDEARRLLTDAFTGPTKQPGAVRDVLAKAMGNLEYADDFYKDANAKIHQEPRLDRGMLSTEFEQGHPLQSYIDKNYKDMAVRGHNPEPIKDGKVPTSEIGRAYIMTPAEVQKFVGRGSLDDIRKNPELGFGGTNAPKRFRIKVLDGRTQLVPE